MPQEKLSATEIIAINTVAQELNKARIDASNIVADIQRAHPGYTFDFNSGQLIKLPEQKKPEHTETHTEEK